jgi:hypothetical protein
MVDTEPLYLDKWLKKKISVWFKSTFTGELEL